MDLAPRTPVPPQADVNPCIPSPCGPYAQCREVNGAATCSCLTNYIGAPPNCRPECTINAECASNMACINERCRDPCPGSCGFSALCNVIYHTPSCSCPVGYTGDPFTSCRPLPPPPPAPKPAEPVDPCIPSPCGANTVCNNGQCSCIPEYHGDPIIGCRPECVLNADCPRDRACVRNKCVDPCPGTCGQRALCDVINHIPMCRCPERMTGNAFVACDPVPEVELKNPCQPSPCGPNSQCIERGGNAICSCITGYFGNPPNCRLECYSSSDCAQIHACINNKCVDPCPGQCGLNAECQAVQHRAHCECIRGYTGNPYSLCTRPEIRQEPPAIQNPCIPSPCGPNAQCSDEKGQPRCSCLADFIGTPPNCRPECSSNDDCPNNLACINRKCRDPCPGSCGFNANCLVTLHIPNCHCPVGMTGDPFRVCYEAPKILPPPPKQEPRDPCRPSPCGPNSECRGRGDSYTCSCINDYIGNPYEGCRPECIGNSECSSNRACIRNKCADPCPGTCGVEALCTIHNHIPICSCPTGYSGNAFVQCSPIVIEHIPQERRDPCYPTPCGINTVCKVQRDQAVCECLPGFFGNPQGQGCRPECTLSSDCAKNKACVNAKCVDPCPGVCGYGAQCQTANHNPICSCPSPMVGNPFVECHVPPQPIDPCNPSPCRSNGICQVINDAATCTYPECVTNEDCSRNRACINQKCRDPCINACGVNAICNAINHKAVCTCPTGYYGSPFNQCLRQMEEIPAPRPECTTDAECSNDKACVNQACQNPCELSNICGTNARCHVQLHRPLCVCNEGYTGNAFSYCHVIGCRSDEECPATEACINKQCTDPCPYTQCGTNAICRADYNHKARCHCPDGYRGNPLVRCERPECTRDDECAFNLACKNERCEDPCNCGVGAQCRVDNHRAQCRCPPGYSGNPLVSCVLEEPKVAPQCTMDADCTSKLACFNGECKNPCAVTQPCGANAICSVVDTLPLRTMICQCEPGYVGDADVGCRKEPARDHGCQSNNECQDTEACRNGVCVNPCIDASPCARTAECLAQRHRAVCSCPQGTQGDPFTNCYQPPEITAGCKHDSECQSTTACINQRCQDPCAEANPCAGNAECRVRNSRPICSCPAGWGGDPQLQCYKPECKINADCPYDKACISENCVNPCSYGEVRCGTGAQCTPQNHQAVCICPPGTQGNPFVSCITGHCQYNEDCADHEACDRLNRVCRPVCDEDTCALNAICTGRRHQPQCECRPGYRGNPFVQCDVPREPPTKVEPECKQDADCPSQLACINQRCANPCATPHVCTPQQTCHVLDTLPLRTMICKCPSDTITDNSGNCVPIKHEVVSGCQSNDECGNTEVCQRGVCIDACRLERCGVNAQCRSRDHYAECTCARGYEGNPRVECQLIVHEQPKTPNAECTKNDDCPYDKTCRNERCVNPCVEDSCGRGAYCHVQNREPVCRCPSGFTGDARVACVPPPDVSTIGCKSNSDCSLSESCVNERCINPCNCGPNAECIVRNHHPVCYCQPGYSGNAQFGCVQIGCQSDDECSSDQQCVNRECVNPCLISDPCALNAECFGRNHRATCRCPAGLEGDPFQRCVRVECHSDYDCATNQACVRNQCVNPCQDSPCAQNAICQALQHRAVCRCPETMPLGNPYAYCERRPVEPVCRDDGDCPSRLACIDSKCQNPCTILSPCASSAKCSVLDSVPVRTMVCECPESYVPDARGECKPIVLQSPPGCSSDADCPDQEACINRQCRNPCNCGTNAICQVQNHRATCSCQDGYEGNPYALCRTIGCRIDSECDSGKACINGNCINPCLVNDPCGINAECYVQSNTAMCRCKSGYRGNAYERCRVIGCLTNNDCPSDKMCQNEQCVNPCIYHNTCSPRAECRAHNHLAVCRCPAGFLGNPYVDCRPEPQPMCKVDTDCPARLACINDECVDPCLTLEPCNRPAQCEVTPTSPVRTMICICPDGYISSGSGTCKPTKTIVEVGGCIADSDCATDKSCVNGICRDPCNCGLNAECRIKDHKPVCTCRQGYDGNPEFECSKIECAINSDCPSTHACRNQLCVPVCQGEQCGTNAECLAVDHRAVCECVPGFRGNARIACTPLGCRTDGECPSDKACVNGKCENPCDTKAICAYDEICKVYNHQPECACPPGTIARRNGCEPQRDIPICRYDGDCPSQTACIRGECVNPCNATHPCGVNADCRVLDTVPVRTMICECLEGYTGNAAVQCDKRSLCVIEKGFVRDVDGQCVCPPGTALDIYEYCAPCLPQQGFKIDENGRCVCALERGMVIDERGRCICPTDHGYRLTPAGECIAEDQPGCETNDDCADNRFCNTRTKTCEDPCLQKVCGVNAFCNAINHRAQCQCITGYTGNPELFCNHTNFRTDFPRPDMLVSCLADGVQVEIHITEPGFNGVLYVKGHSKDEECRRVVNLAGESVPRTEIFRVHFGSCGMQAVKDIASFVLVIQKHPKLVTYKAQAYNIKCVYQTGEKNVTLGFNVSMLTTAGTIANTGPPPICQMRIITHEGEEINSAEIGDNLKLQVDVEPATIYGGFARSCIAKTMEDNIENEYIVTDENGCATDASIFGEWEYNADTNSLMANFNAFKFPSSDNIRFQCNIRVCFGKCQPVNCRGYNAFGRRRRRAIADNSTDTTAVATDTGMEGQLREEITISSNAILTFEKRSGPGISDANIKPAAQRVEDICVSMVGLIIALVITALLALVAVAVAVSCWLMAYRRRPKTLAPLPHPPEFPNPLFANPEAVPEPTPDYLS